MKALLITEHHDVDRLEIRDAEPAPLRASEVRVRVEAAGINPSDLVSLRGRFPQATLPRILGRDFAGVVVDGDASLVGAPVWGTGGDLGITRDGTHAELVALPRAAVAIRPSNLGAVTAGAAALPFVTAWSALDLAELQSGEIALVSGAAGAVGHAATELALARGARVVALVRSEDEGRRFAAVERRDPGGIVGVVASDHADVAGEIRRVTGGQGVDVALNGVGAPVFRAIFDTLAHGGRLVAYAGAPGAEAPFEIFGFYRRRLTFRGLDTARLDAVACAELLGRMKALFESGAIRPTGALRTFSFAEAKAAYAYAAGGPPQKAVLTFAAPA